jgi:hypothetical protein
MLLSLGSDFTVSTFGASIRITSAIGAVEEDVLTLCAFHGPTSAFLLTLLAGYRWCCSGRIHHAGRTLFYKPQELSFVRLVLSATLRVAAFDEDNIPTGYTRQAKRTSA